MKWLALAAAAAAMALASSAHAVTVIASGSNSPSQFPLPQVSINPTGIEIVATLQGATFRDVEADALGEVENWQHDNGPSQPASLHSPHNVDAGCDAFAGHSCALLSGLSALPSFGSLTVTATSFDLIFNAIPINIYATPDNGISYLGNLESLVNSVWVDYATVNDGATFSYTITALGAVPEPGAWALSVLGFGLLGAILRRRRPSALSF